jgi:proteasome lid subunit RPN8/RPN11
MEMGMSPQISRPLLDRLHVIVAADPAREVCGLLLGRDGQVEAIAEAANVAADPRIAFEIEPRVQIDALKAARAGGPAVIGCYHSHPSGLAQPSRRDVDMAQPGDLWLIFAPGQATAWLRGNNEFERLTLDIH